ncbi:MAG: CBO0543 family protein [Bacillota bacterium]
MKQNLIVFFSKGVVSTLVDTYVVADKRVAYPIRPFPGVFKTNIIFDMLFFPLLSVVWVKQTYNDGLWKILLKSLTWSVPMSITQWFLVKYTKLIQWKKWSPFHTFGSVSFTLFIIRGLVSVVKRLDQAKST